VGAAQAVLAERGIEDSAEIARAILLRIQDAGWVCRNSYLHAAPAEPSQATRPRKVRSRGVD